MEFTCPTCTNGTASDGNPCAICGGDGLIDLTDPAFKSIDFGTRKVLSGIVWDVLLTNTTMPTNVFHAYEILEATDEAEYDALSDANKLVYNALISCGRVDMNDGKKGKTWLWSLFDSESTTRAALIALLA